MGAPQVRDHRADVSEAEFAAIGRRLDELVQEFETMPFPQVREAVFELLQTVDALHRAGLGRLLGTLEHEDGGAAVARAAEDPVVRMLLTLYYFLPGDAPFEVEPAPPPANFIPLAQIGRRPAAANQPPAFIAIARVEDVPPGTLHEVAADGIRALIANVDGDIYAVGAVCPGSMAPLGLGAYTPPVLVCPWHNEAFDIRTGKRADGEPRPVLDVLSVAVNDGIVSVAAPAAKPPGLVRQSP